ncbi:vascular cell adhesion protein 1-like, partial [Orbicella faveolata]|uniref:vascular cell adhesion protein 1-like n=1 Tax=Orbicella faveolata TaxID=48498 RepID=UPI0009E4F695
MFEKTVLDFSPAVCKSKGTPRCFFFISDAGSVTWYEPPPIETTSDHSIELTADSRQLLEGSTHVQLSWNFSLTPDLSPSSVILRLNSVQVAVVVLLSGVAGITSGFERRFNFTWISQRATLIIFNVTEEDDGEFTCHLSTFQGVDQKLWKRKMKVEVIAFFSVETSFTSSPSSPSGDQTVNEGSNLTLFCDASGKPTPNVSWSRVLKNGTDGDVVFFGNPWVILNISRTGTGTYR